jgi:hypothetical protein
VTPVKFIFVIGILLGATVVILEAGAIAHGAGATSDDVTVLLGQSVAPSEEEPKGPESNTASTTKSESDPQSAIRNPQSKNPQSAIRNPQSKDGKKAPEAIQATKAAKPLPRTVPLPAAGEWKASDLFPIAEKLHGVKVEPETPGAANARVLITSAMAGRSVNREDLAILLGAFQVFLFPLQRKDGRVLVASLDPEWTAEKAAARQPRLFRKFPIRASMFEVVRKQVGDYLAQKNQELPDGAPESSLAADPRTSVLIVQAASPRTIAGVEEIVRGALQSAPESMRLHSFSPTSCRAEDLREKLLESLSEPQRGKISVVVPRAKNILLIRAPDQIYEEIEERLRTLDRKGLHGKSEVGSGKSEAPEKGEGKSPE